jgi:hypothetical protein
MIKTLDNCSIYVYRDGSLFDKKPLSLDPIKPIKGHDKDFVISIPERLKDPATNEIVETSSSETNGGGKLILKTSDKSMSWGLKSRHNMIYRAYKSFVGFTEMMSLGVQSSFVRQIYGECHLDALDEYKTNDRTVLAKSPLTRAVEEFVKNEVEKYAREFEKDEKIKISQKDKQNLSKMNEALDKWKNKLLKEMIGGLWGPGTGPGNKPFMPLPVGKVNKIELKLTYQKIGVGITVKPIVHFYDKTGTKIRPVPYTIISEDNNIAVVDPETNVVTTCSLGKVDIYAEAIEQNVKSNKEELEVVKVRKIEILPKEVSLKIGGKNKLDAICELSDGSKVSDVYLIWSGANDNIVKVSPSGMVYGYGIGKTEVIAGDDNCTSDTPAKVSVEAGDGTGPGDKEGGKGFPRILISGVDPDPETNEEVNFRKDEPPVTQRPSDVEKGIWWINSSAPLAKKYQEFGTDSSEWRIYHLERYVEIIAQISMSQSDESNLNLPASEWLGRWGGRVSEIQSFMVETLSDFIKEGKLPLV